MPITGWPTVVIVVVSICMQHFQSYGEMIKRCKGVSIEASLKSTNWNVSMFQRAFALYHDQVQYFL